MTDDRRDPKDMGDPRPAGPGGEADPSETKERPPEVPIFSSPSPSKRWQGGGGASRWTSWGCVAGIILLVAMLVFGVAITKKTAWIAFDRGQRRVLTAAEGLNSPSERLRTSRNLERFKVQLRIAGDPYPEMGEFLKIVRAGFEDGRLTADELEEINGYLESKLPMGAAHGMKE